ncbi:GntR family transcriptional regulator [Clostridium oryzae]|uniref:Putative HTH-type transcriptional regulator YurK n=1 Tax=Clostridium oryzae TaxID=1450648 RepID=A0A1V4IDT4_9CLOT|nr:GntR family transcriptional regulator [Clostridium oryzae]OPJ58024.1 putative HTH-type transcriptional regulator YurK [Clostridium oryzae]
MKLNPSSTIPLFEQLKEEIKNQIRNGIYTQGQKIPTELELNSVYGISRITIRRAIEDLVKEGILTKKQGKGTFVQEKKLLRKIEHTISFSDACISNNMKPSCYVTKREVLAAHSHEVQNTGLFNDEQAIYIQRIRLADNIPIMCENNYYPYDRYYFLLTEELNGSLYNLLENKYDIQIGTSKNSYIDVVKADSKNSKLLNVPLGEPLFLLCTEMYDTSGKLIHVGRQFIVGSRYRFCYDII